MSYTKTNWENSPLTNTPLSAENLNHLENGVASLHEALNSGTLKGDKGDKVEKGSKGNMGVGIKKITSSKVGNVVTLNIELTDG